VLYAALNPTPYTVHPAPRTLHPAPCILHQANCDSWPFKEQVLYVVEIFFTVCFTLEVFRKFVGQRVPAAGAEKGVYRV